MSALWVYLAASPLLWLTATLVAYLLADALSARLARPAWAHPVLLAVAALVALLRVTGTDYQTYFAGAQFAHFLLGPATVALAVPLARELPRVRRYLWPTLGALLAGSLSAIVSAVGIGWALGAGPGTLASMAPKSVTTPIAMAVAQTVGGIPALTAALVIPTGIIAAVSLAPMLRLLRLDRAGAAMSDATAAGVGLAAGVAGGGIGTAQALQLSALAGAFGGLGLALNGLLTSLLVPALAALVRIIGI